MHLQKLLRGNLYQHTNKKTFNKINAFAKVIERKPISTHQQKLSQKRAITQPKFGGWLPISNLTCILQWYKVLQSLNEINASLQKLLSGNERQKLSRKRDITQPKFGGWLSISNLACILQWYKVLLSLNEISASLQTLLSGNEKCDNDTVDASNDAYRQHDPYVSALLRRRHKNYTYILNKIIKKVISFSFPLINIPMQPVSC